MSICLAEEKQDIRQCVNCPFDDQCAKQLAYYATDTLCPCPPETSPLGEVDGGILARLELLKESVPVNGSVIPLNLE